MDKLEVIKSKIIQKDNLKTLISFWKFKDKKIVFTNGCFDIIHRGHIEYLAKAASCGDILIIGLNTDESVKRLKGETRPLQDEFSRAMVLASLSFVDNVILFNEDTPYELIKIIQPDILIKGSDYKPEDIVGYEVVKDKGGAVITIDFVDGYSTTNIIDKITNK
ncbi:MAG: D-glycero-beta-D-manno-heptose 1-phosphate adenylyltransferase [Bacteroidales bacterium]|nr:D-glycero-beta-D-manno-heptose 1-phosphate adenylyltransferase [Bacteroidales bacterium]